MKKLRNEVVEIREMASLSPLTYFDKDNKIRLNCYADTYVYHKVNGKERNLVAMRFGGYPEQVRAMTDTLYKGVSVEAVVENASIILYAKNKAYKRSISHDGNYAEAVIQALDDESCNLNEDEQLEVEKPEEKRRMYIYCEEGNTDSLYAELDKKTSIPLIPEFKDYILEECFKKKILVQLEVLSSSVRFDAYLLEMRNDEKEMEEIVNIGLRTGRISIPNAIKGSGFENIKTVSQYLNKYGITIANRIRESFNPLFDPAAEDICDRIKKINGNLKKNVGYSLYPAQLAVAEAVKRRLDRAKVAMIVAECGSGKTKIGSVALAAHQNGKKTFNAVLCPSHVTKKWVREIEETLPDTKARVVYNLADVDNAYNEFQKGNKSEYIILSKERARDGYMRRPAVIRSKSKKAYICPWCYEKIMMEEKRDGTNYLVNADQFFFRKENNQNHKCQKCGKPLWTVLNPNDKKLSHNKWIKIGGYGFIYRDFAERHLKKTSDSKVIAKVQSIIDNPNMLFIARGAYVRYSLSSYLAEHIKNIDGVILDELHQFKGDSGQGDAMETLVGCSKKVIGMTATLVNGYSSGMFYLLYRIVPRLMKIDNKSYDSPQLFNNEYGVTESVYELEEGEYNANSKSSKKLLHTRQRPGVSPLVYSRFLIDCAVFLSLNDMGKHLPEYEEIPIQLELREDIKKAYDKIEETYKDCMKWKERNPRRIMSKFFSLLTTYPDQPYGNEPIYYLDSDVPLMEPEDISSIDELNEKDEATLDIVGEKVGDGGRVLIYTNWVRTDTQKKLKKLIEKNGYRVAVLEQKIIPEKREEWVEKRLEEGINVLITNPSLVETGLDLNAFTTLIFYDIGYNLFTFRQSSRRSWRINQTAPRIEVYILYFKGVLQARAIRLMANKLAAATLVEGNFSDEGLAAMSDSGDMTSELAKELTKGIRDEVEDIAEMYKKMAILKDGTEAGEDLADYAIMEDDEELERVAEFKVLSITDKIQQAMLLARQLKETKAENEVKTNNDYSRVNEQLSLFDLLDIAS